MPVVTIVSEDPVFSGLLTRNLQEHGYRVEAHLLNASPAGGPALPSGDTPQRLCILDLGWFDQPHEARYALLLRWCRELHHPPIILADNTWPHARVQAFGAGTILRKPFPMGLLMQAVDKASKVRPAASPRPRGRSGEA